MRLELLLVFGYYLFLTLLVTLRPLKIPLWLAVTLALGPLLFSRLEIGDTRLYETVGYFFSRRLDFYFYDSNHDVLPYLPGLTFILGPIYMISQATHLPFFTLWRIFLALPLLGLGWLLKERATLFILSPLTIFPVFYHGHPDVLVIFLYLFGSGVSTGLALLIKSWPVIFLPLLFLRRKRLFLTMILTVAVICFVYIRFWHSTPALVSSAVSSYGGGESNYWGLVGLVNLLAGRVVLASDLARQIYTAAFLGLTYLVVLRLKPGFVRETTVVLAFLLFSASFSIQYVFWVWPFILLTEPLSTARLVSLASVPYIFTAYFLYTRGVEVYPPALLIGSSLPLYFLLLKIFFQRLKESRREVQRGK